MAASTANTGYGATFGIEGVTPGTYVVVAEVIGITAPNMSRSSQEVTHLTSDDEYHEFIGGFRDGGEVSLTLNYIAANATALIAAFDADKGNYEITLPNADALTFSGFCNGYQLGDLTPDGRIESSATFKVSGKPALA